tara:strand:+ start:77 stop:733 length:657 start_codon:yes stop_codon:yes gene_type:complete
MILLLDIFNVQVESTYPKALQHFLISKAGADGIEKWGAVERILHRYEMGTVELEDVGWEIAELLDCDFTFEEFKDVMEDIGLRLNPGLTSYIGQLMRKGHFKTLVASNISRMHEELLGRDKATRKINAFPGYRSWRMGLRKPDPAFFQYIIDKEYTKPGDFLFIDDTHENVVAARSVGMRAETFRMGLGSIFLRSILIGHKFVRGVYDIDESPSVTKK